VTRGGERRERMRGEEKRESRDVRKGERERKGERKVTKRLLQSTQKYTVPW
jgi:hypothetical protein